MRHGNAKKDMSQMYGAKRKREQRDKMRAAGFKLIQCWVHPDDRKKVQKISKKLNEKRLNQPIPRSPAI